MARIYRLMRGCWLHLSLLFFLMNGGVARSEGVYALVVGADDYQHIDKLKGAVNDAEAITTSLKAAGAREVVTLENQQATRQAIVNAFHDLATKAGKDNGWLVFTYAGHGSREPGRVAGDRMHDVIILPLFNVSAPANGERLLDDEIKALLQSAPASAKILFVADACHSGTLTRKIDPRSSEKSVRVANYGPIQEDVLPPPVPSKEATDVAQLPNVLFVAAALDTEVTPEVPFEGQMHGAVSWFLTKAIAGAADANGDGVTTFAELQQYIGVTARQAVESRQTPSVNFLPGREAEILPFKSRAGGATAPLPELPKLAVFVEGGDRDLGVVPGAVRARDRNAADLIWDVKRHEVINNHQGDLVAQEEGPSADPTKDTAFVSGVVEKWRVLGALKSVRAGSPVAVKIGPKGEGAAYQACDPARPKDEACGQVTITIQPRSNRKLQYLTVVNLAGDGKVQWLFPVNAAEAGPQDPTSTPIFQNAVSPPYGADHIVVIATDAEPKELRQVLKALDGRSAAHQAYDLITAGVKGHDFGLGVVGIYTQGAM